MMENTSALRRLEWVAAVLAVAIALIPLVPFARVG